MIVIQAALLTAVQLHPAATVTARFAVDPPAATLAEDDEITGVHEAPAWVTVKVLPATVKVPVRDPLLGFAAAV